MAAVDETASGRTRRRVSVVPHTHWDREWYSPFQTFRLQLVDLLDELLPRLDADPSYAHFMLDGQLAVVDDYLAARPHHEATLRDLAAGGRLSVGPWYSLPDEFLVSGETLIRDLQLGIRRAAALGGTMEVGYLPDMFGHIAQMPQLLRQFGFEHAVVWRGVPSAVDRSGFWWTAPDGSTVRAEYLPQGYGNGAIVPDDAKQLVERIDQFAEVHGDILIGPILWMNGTDHLAPQPWLGRVVADVNASNGEYELVIRSLAAHLAEAPTDALPEWTGELRSGARANLLMGVASNRVDVHQAAGRAERALEQVAEPLCAVHLPADAWPATLLDEAWLGLIRNAAHDSVCACSIDEVCDAVLHRYGESTRIAEGLASRAAEALAATIDADGPVIVNPSARSRSGLVEIILPGTGGEPPGTQTLSVRDETVVLQRFESPALAAGIVAELDYIPRFTSASIVAADEPGPGGGPPGGQGTELFAASRPAGGSQLISPDERRLLVALLAETDPRPVDVVVTQQPGRKVLARVSVPGFGWSAWGHAPAIETAPAVTTDGDGMGLANGLVSLRVDGADGTWSMDGHDGLGRLVDGGDAGDTYNWCPPADDVVIDRPDAVDVTVTEAGPLRSRIAIRSHYRWPVRSNLRGRSAERAAVDVTTTLELRAGERFVRVGIGFVNRARDHRVRAWFPLPSPADHSEAECAFAIVRRGLDAEGGPTELPLPTFPSRRFVRAGGLTVAHEGLHEYELVDIADGRARALAVTLARCTGMLSQGPMPTRPLPAGPFTPMEGPQLQQPLELRLAVAVGDIDPYAMAEDAFVPLVVTPNAGGAPSTRPPIGSAVELTGAEVSAVRRTPGGSLELRVFNPTADTAEVQVAGRRGWIVDLRGRPVEPFEDRFALGPWKIATLVLGSR